MHDGKYSINWICIDVKSSLKTLWQSLSATSPTWPSTESIFSTKQDLTILSNDVEQIAIDAMQERERYLSGDRSLFLRLSSLPAHFWYSAACLWWEDRTGSTQQLAIPDAPPEAGICYSNKDVWLLHPSVALGDLTRTLKLQHADFLRLNCGFIRNAKPSGQRERKTCTYYCYSFVRQADSKEFVISISGSKTQIFQA